MSGDFFAFDLKSILKANADMVDDTHVISDATFGYVTAQPLFTAGGFETVGCAQVIGARLRLRADVEQSRVNAEVAPLYLCLSNWGYRYYSETLSVEDVWCVD